MQTRRSKKAAEAAEAALSSSPPQPIVRRNPPRGTTRRTNQRAINRTSRDSSSLPGSPSSPSSPTSPSSSPAGPLHSSSPLRRRSPLLPPIPPPSQRTPSLPRHASSPALAGVEPPRGLTSVPRKNSIVFDPKPRRGAPRQPSVSSIATFPKRDYTDDEDYDQVSAPEPRSATEIMAERMAQREIEEVEHEIWLEAIPSLARDAKSFIRLLQNKSTRLAYHKVLQMKTEAFKTSRSIFFAPGQQKSPFLGWDWVDSIEDNISNTAKTTVPLAIKLANIATALNQIEGIETEREDLIPFLDALDDALFPRYFAADENKQFVALSLEIRTQLAIENVARLPQSIDLRGELGHAFCAMKGPNAPASYPALFAHGPYKPLAGLAEEDLIDVCSDRVMDVWEIMSEGGKRGIRTPVDLSIVRKKYSLQHMLGHLKKWLLHRYSTISKLLENAEQEQAAKEREKLLDQLRAEEELRQRKEQQTQEEERQAREEERRARDQQRRAREEEELRAKEQALEKKRQAWEKEKEKEKLLRARQHNDQRRAREETWTREERDKDEFPPLFGEDSLFHQDIPESSPQSVASSQPASQRRIQRREKAPTDYSLFQRREMATLLRDVSLSGPPTSSRTRQWLPDSESPRRRPRQESRHQQESNYNEKEGEEEAEEAEEQEEDDDDFDVDRRPIKRSKTTASSAPSSRARPQQQQQQQQAHRQAAAAAAAVPTSSAPSPPPSSLPDFVAIERIKTLARINARLSNPQSLKKRHVWSDRDSATLIDLIARRAASWAVINNEDGHLFELPRNAQAYRDRARNMKVDFLISDAVLPHGFDLVTLSKKEIDRLEKLGKNYARMERDVDRNGKPTNTEAIL